jgi:hypothetical protein
MSEHSNDRFQDPKPFNTVSLINQRNHIKLLIDTGQASQAFTEMTTLVCEFDLNSKDTTMAEVKAALIKNKKNPYLKCAEDIEFYDKINKYMNTTYCRGFKAPMGEDFFPTLGDENNDGTNSSES